MSDNPLELKRQLAACQSAISIFMSSWGDRNAVQRLTKILEDANAACGIQPPVPVPDCQAYIPADTAPAPMGKSSWESPTHEVNEGRINALKTQVASLELVAEQARTNTELYKSAAERFQRAHENAIKRLAGYAQLGAAVDAILRKWREMQPHIGDVDIGRFVELAEARGVTLSGGPPPPAGPIQRMVAAWEERNAAAKVERDAVDALIEAIETDPTDIRAIDPLITAVRETRK